MKKIGWIIGLLLIAGAGSVRWAGMDWWQTRVPEDWHFKAEYLGNSTRADTEGQLPEKRDISKYTRERIILEWSRDRALIEDRFTTRNIQTGKITFEFIIRLEVDPKTGKHLRYPNHPEISGHYYLFPRDVTKKIYSIADYMPNIFPVHFVQETIMEGLTVYEFHRVITLWMKKPESKSPSLRFGPGRPQMKTPQISFTKPKEHCSPETWCSGGSQGACSCLGLPS